MQRMTVYGQKGAFISLIVLLLAGNALATSLAINPGRVYLDYEPGLNKTLSFTVINSEEERKEVSLEALGDLAESVNLEASNLTLEAGESRTVSFNLLLPEDMEPGIHNANVMVRLVPQGVGGAGLIGATVALIFQAVVQKPYPEEYGILSDFTAGDTELGETASFSFTFKNLGNSTVDVTGLVDIYDAQGILVEKLSTPKESVGSMESVTLKASWDTGNATKGLYKASSHIEYAGRSTETVEYDFRVGEMLMELTRLEAASMYPGDVGRISLGVQNYWNEDVSGAYIIVEILDDGKVAGTVKSESFTVEPWSGREVTVYWDSKGFNEGEYTINATLYYAGKTAWKGSSMQLLKKSPAIGLQNLTIPWVSGGGEMAAVVLFLATLLVSADLLRRRRLRKRILQRLDEIDCRLDSLNAELSGKNTSKRGG